MEGYFPIKVVKKQNNDWLQIFDKNIDNLSFGRVNPLQDMECSLILSDNSTSAGWGSIRENHKYNHPFLFCPFCNVFDCIPMKQPSKLSSHFIDDHVSIFNKNGAFIKKVVTEVQDISRENLKSKTRVGASVDELKRKVPNLGIALNRINITNRQSQTPRRTNPGIAYTTTVTTSHQTPRRTNPGTQQINPAMTPGQSPITTIRNVREITEITTSWSKRQVYPPFELPSILEKIFSNSVRLRQQLASINLKSLIGFMDIEWGKHDLVYQVASYELFTAMYFNEFAPTNIPNLNIQQIRYGNATYDVPQRTKDLFRSPNAPKETPQDIIQGYFDYLRGMYNQFKLPMFQIAFNGKSADFRVIRDQSGIAIPDYVTIIDAYLFIGKKKRNTNMQGRGVDNLMNLFMVGRSEQHDGLQDSIDEAEVLLIFVEKLLRKFRRIPDDVEVGVGPIIEYLMKMCFTATRLFNSNICLDHNNDKREHFWKNLGLKVVDVDNIIDGITT